MPEPLCKIRQSTFTSGKLGMYLAGWKPWDGTVLWWRQGAPGTSCQQITRQPEREHSNNHLLTGPSLETDFKTLFSDSWQMLKKAQDIAIIRGTLGQNNSQRIRFLLLSLSTTPDLRTEIKAPNLPDRLRAAVQGYILLRMSLRPLWNWSNQQRSIL